MRNIAVLAIAAFVSSCSAPVVAKPPVYVIAGDIGGPMTVYQDRYTKWAAEKASVRIDGECASGCTLVLSKKYNLKVCATDKANIQFHMPYFLEAQGKYLLATDYFKAKSVVAWYDDWIYQMPSSISNVLLAAGVPSVYKGDKASDMRGWAAPAIYRHVTKCKPE